MGSGRLLAIGDIHGCKTALDAVLAAVELQPDDTLITLGDYIDRGPDSRGVLDTLIALFEADHILPLRGNHELMMMRARDSLKEERFWRNFGGQEAIESYDRDDRPARLADVPDRHWKFMATDCKDWHETYDFIFAHAGINPAVSMSMQTEDALFWQTLSDRGPHVSGKTVICGHTPQINGLPRNLGHTICIDTGAFAGGWLTVLNVRTGEYWQGNEAGEVATGLLNQEH